MSLHSERKMGIQRFILSVVMFIAVSSTLMQLDIPTFDNLQEYFSDWMLSRQLQLAPAKEEDLLQQGWVYYNLGDYAKAQNVLEKVVQKEDNISAVYCLALIDMAQRKWEDAADKLEQVTARYPGHAASRLNLGKTYFQQRYFGQARKNFEAAVKLEPTDEETRLWLGKTYLMLNKDDLAIDMLNTVTHGDEAVEAAALLKNLHMK